MAKTIEIKVTKRTLMNALLAIAVLAVVLQAVELGLIAYAMQSGALCK